MVSEHVRHKPSCTSSGDCLRGFAFAYAQCLFSHDAAHLIKKEINKRGPFLDWHFNIAGGFLNMLKPIDMGESMGN